MTDLPHFDLPFRFEGLSGELIPNGDFADGLTHWYAWTGSSGSSGSDVVLDGQAAKVTILGPGDGNSGIISLPAPPHTGGGTDLVFRPRQQYRSRCRVKTAAGIKLYVYIDHYDVVGEWLDGSQSDFVGTGDWQTVEFTFTPPAGAVTSDWGVYVVLGEPSGVVFWLDDVGVTAVVGSTATAAVVEQDSIDEIANAALAILVCPKGFRVELPEFGLPDPTFSTPALDLDEIANALDTWEPRSASVLTQQPDALDELVVRAQVYVRVRTTD